MILRSQVKEARRLMALGFSLRETAAKLRVLSSDLDLALWRYIGEKIL